ncbi:MAG: GFA family protein [Methylophilaceae bacterium]
MSSTVEAHGKCLCGAVEVTAKTMDPEVGACHCSMCRKWAGGVFLVVDCKKEVEFSGEENISVFNSSEWGERGFCAKCGTNLFYRLKENNQYFMSSELFDAEVKFHFGHQVFIEEKPEYYAFANDTKNMTGAELFAQFSSD